tara:strand:+ start:552 stop:1076 length:525 start_codon:yes stop_codon:yes gene_type:complete
MSNLRLLNETTVTSSVASVSVTDVFSSDFDIYKIIFTDMEIQTSDYTSMRLITSSGSIVTNSAYDNASQIMYAHTSFFEAKNTNDNKFYYLNYLYPNGYDDGNGNTIYIFNPFNTSSYTSIINQSSGFANGTGNYNFKGVGVLKETSSISGFQLFRTGNIDNIKIRTYGLRVDT